MPEQYSSEPLLDMFLFETTQLLEQLETCILSTEKTGYYSQDVINDIFRIMHTIKGSSAMMKYENISELTHSMEDLFYFIREKTPKDVNYSELSDLVLQNVDFIKAQVDKVKSGNTISDDASTMIAHNKEFLSKLQHPKANHYAHSYKAVIYFKEGCEMENIRAFNVIHNLEDIAGEIRYIPDNIMNSEAAEVIKRDGFTIFLKSDYTYVDIHQLLMQTIFLKELELEELDQTDDKEPFKNVAKDKQQLNEEQNTLQEHSPQQHSSQQQSIQQISQQQSIISVPVTRLDLLMNLMGEFVIAEAMVTQNPDLKWLKLDNFQKAARQLNKITNELQDVVMSIRMVPLSATFQKMNRIVRDMSKKLNKNVNLKIIGEETEVDKNIIEHISDPLMHLVRNAIDHGIEPYGERERLGKPTTGTITLEAKNAGSDVLIIVKDDGHGLDSKKILEKARNQGLLYKSENEMTVNEINNLVLMPGFSTNDNITEFSGRGVGMDVVTKNIESVGGTVSIDSVEGAGTAFIMKIPLTLAIIDGMNISVGSSIYTIPTINIKESFRPDEKDIFTAPEGSEMIMVRGQCYPILRLHKQFNVNTDITSFYDGIIIMAEQDSKTICIFVDKLLGQQQVVVKALPEYIRGFKKTKGLAGCTLLGDGSISLILDIAGLAGLRE